MYIYICVCVCVCVCVYVCIHVYIHVYIWILPRVLVCVCARDTCTPSAHRLLVNRARAHTNTILSLSPLCQKRPSTVSKET